MSNLLIATRNGDLERVLSFLHNGTKINTKINNCLPLHQASTFGHLEIVQLFLDNGADIYSTNADDKSTALHYASYHGQCKVAQLLIDNGAYIHARNKYGDTPLHNASYWKNVRMVQLLLNNGAYVHAKNKDGNTSLHQACLGCNHLDIIKLLLEHGANPDCYNNNRILPSHIGSNLRVYKLLTDYEKLYNLKEWRPWNHFKYPLTYRQATTTVALLAKIINN